MGGMMSKEGFDVSEAQKMASRLPTLLTAARTAGVLMVFVRNVYSTSAEFSPAGQNKPANIYLSDAWLEQAITVNPTPITPEWIAMAVAAAKSAS
jgi:hypothetical protein